VQLVRRAADMALPEHCLEQHQEIQVGAGKINFIQHMAEIISLDSVSLKCDLLPRRAAFAVSRGATSTGAIRMPTSRRSVLAATGAGLALLDMAGTRHAAALPCATPATAKEVAGLIQRSTDANSALMRGDIDGYLALITHTEDFTLMSPFGGTPTRGFELKSEHLAALGRFFKNGKADLEVVQSYGSADMVVLAVIERQRVEVGGLPEQDWSLRVTLVYRRDVSDWRLVHRHADPLVKGISLNEAAAIARG
jgi:ketosteroid isomerase-like protein